MFSKPSLLLKAEQLQLSQLFLEEVFLLSPPVDQYLQGHIFPVLWIPELEAAVQVQSHWSKVEGQNHLPQSDDGTAFNAAQDALTAGTRHGFIPSFSSTSTLKSFSTEKLSIPLSSSLY